MDMTLSNIIQILVYLISISSLGGAILTRISALEKKVEKHNNLIERMYRCEESLKSVHKRVDELREGRK